MVLSFILLTAGFILLIKGADYLIDGASSLAAKFSMSEIVIGLTVVAFGTSAPELIVNIFASIENRPEITFGNVTGSNIVNILLILGLAGTISVIETRKNTVWKEIPFALLAGTVLFVMCNDMFFDGCSSVISRGDGIILLMFFIIFMTYTFGISKVDAEQGPEIKKLGNLKITALIIAGLAGLFIGGKLVVDSAVGVARGLGVSDKLISLSIISIGTSLPELVTSTMAAYRKKSDIAIGNIVGSNIFNIFFILGISAVIAPVPFSPALNADLFVLLIASILLFITMFTGKKRSLDRWEAIIFLLLYAAYTVFLIVRK